jgi:hypothetical protein
MLKFDSLKLVTNSTSKSLIPRNLTYKYNNENNNTQNNIVTSSQNSSNFNTAIIKDLSTGTINAYGTNLNPFIIFQGNVAFSLLPSEYNTNNFKNYPILFTKNILVNNTNFTLNTNSLIIKDNVILINNQIENNTILNNSSDIFISGLIFPIIDKNSSTGTYSGLLYLPNYKIQKKNNISNTYVWSSTQYFYFTNQEKGFYKLKYLPSQLNFSNYQNNMDSNYIDLLDNNNNLTNLLIGSLGITDGELALINKQYLNINISDGINRPNTIVTFNLDSFFLKNNIDLIFDSSLNIKNKNNNVFINFSNNLITLNNDILLNNNTQIINFKDNLLISSNNNNYVNFNNTNVRIEFNQDVLINNLIIITSLQINFPDLIFNNIFNIGANIENVFTPFINFISTPNINSINLLMPTFADNLNINNSLIFKNLATFNFTNLISFNSSQGDTYLNINEENNTVNFIKPVNINNLFINTNLNLENNVAIIINNNFSVKDNNNNNLLYLDSIYSKFYYNIYINKNLPSILFDDDNTLTLNSLNPLVQLQITQNNINIIGPYNSTSTSNNIIIGSSFNVSNISCNYSSGLNLFTYTPISKLYVLSGSTKPNEQITFNFTNLFSLQENTLQFSGKLNIITRSPDSPTSFFSIYDINIWTTPDSLIEFSNINPINSNIGDWKINSLVLMYDPLISTTNLIITCSGSLTYNVIWGVRLEGLSI